MHRLEELLLREEEKQLPEEEKLLREEEGLLGGDEKPRRQERACHEKKRNSSRGR